MPGILSSWIFPSFALRVDLVGLSLVCENLII